MILRRALAVPVLAAALVAGGCGGGEDELGSAAERAPASTQLFLTINTDFESEQYDRARALVERFPDGDTFVQRVIREAEREDDVDFERDVRPALGQEASVAFLEFPREGEEPPAVGILEPGDEEKLRQLLEQDGETVWEEEEGWYLVAEDEETLERFKQAREDGSLAEADGFEEAMDDLPDDALAKVYLRGEGLRQAIAEESGQDARQLEQLLPGRGIPSIGVAVNAEEEGVRFEARGRAEGEEGETYEATLPEELPAGALLFVSFNDLADTLRRSLETASETQPNLDRQLAQAELALGVSIEDDLFPLLDQEGALAVYPGAESQLAAVQPAGFPTVTLLLEVDDEERARATLDKIARRATALSPDVQVQETEIAGVEATQVSIAPQTAVFYAVVEGRVVVTTTEDGIAALQEEGEKLADDPLYSQARETAEAPDETTGFAFVNLEDAVPFVLQLSEQSQGEQVPPQVAENLEALRSLLLVGTRDGDRFRVAGFLGIGE